MTPETTYSCLLSNRGPLGRFCPQCGLYRTESPASWFRGSALPPTRRSTMALADFSKHRHLPSARDLPRSTHSLSRGRTCHPRIRSSLGVSFQCRITLAVGLLTQFLFVKTPFCIRLLSVLPSRAAPCLQLMIPPTRLIRDSHPIACEYAWHTQKSLVVKEPPGNRCSL